MIRQHNIVLSATLAFLTLPIFSSDLTPGSAWGAETNSAQEDSLRSRYASFTNAKDLKRGTLSPADELWNGWTWDEQRDCLKWLSTQRRDKYRHEDIEIEIDGELMAEIKEGISVCYFRSGVIQTKDVALTVPPRESDRFPSTRPDSILIVDDNRDSTKEGVSKSNAVDLEVLPELKSIPAPEYPLEARTSGMTGVVKLLVLIGKSGRVRSIIVDSGPSVFIRSAVEAAREARFVPAQYKGAPVAVWMIIPIRYALPSR